MKIRKMRKSLHVTLAVLMSETLKIPFFSSLFVCLFVRSFVRSFVRFLAVAVIGRDGRERG